MEDKSQETNTKLPTLIAKPSKGFRHKILFPAKRWLTLQHFTAIVMILYAISLATNPTIPVVALGKAMNINGVPIIFALIFTFCAAFLIGKPVSELHYRFLLLSLFIFSGVQVWYVLAVPVSPTTGQPTSWNGVVSALAIWGFFNIAGTQLPNDSGDNDNRRLD